MYELLYSPKTGMKAVEKSEIGMGFMYLIISVILWFFAAKIQGSTWLVSLYVLLGILVLVLVGSLVLNLGVAVFGKANYSKSLLTLVTPWFILSVFAFIASLLALIPAAGVYLVALLLVFALPYALLVEIKVFMDLFKVDLLTAVVILFVLSSATLASFSAIMASFAPKVIATIGFGLLPMGL